MSERTEELIRLYRHFGSDAKRLLTEYPSLENMEAFSDRREGLLEWFDFRPGASLLSVGSGDGALTAMYLRKGLKLTVADCDAGALQLVQMRAEREAAERISELCCVRLAAADGGQGGGALHAMLENSLPAEQSYDYIVFDGTLRAESEEEILWAKSHLAEGGALIAAADNAYGIRAFAGAKTSACAMEEGRLTRLLMAGEEAGSISRYYAEPLRTLPGAIYSERRLPGEGELSRVIPAYGFPAYLAIDPGAKYDEVCRDGVFSRFADSFLYIWRKEEAGEGAAQASDILFAKYNRNRRPAYRLKTVIREHRGELRVEKSALEEEGRAHIQGFLRRWELLCAEKNGICYAEPELSSDGGTAVFPWVSGLSLTELILREIRGGRGVYEVLREALNRVAGGGELHNLDSIFDNFLVEGGAVKEAKLSGIDYEWVTEEPADSGFVRYRALLAFYEQQRETLQLPGSEEFFGQFGIDGKEIARCEKMERDFQAMVSGDEQAVYLDRFVVELRSSEEIEKTERDLQIARERLQGFRAELREKDAVIRKQTEVKRLTDNHVANLEAMIRDLRRETGALGETLAYLSRHQTLYARLRRRAGDAFNRRYPKGSAERKRLMYRKDAFLHPLRHRRMLATEEGRNLMEGDLAIGDLYRERGKLSFPRAEHPLVSVIIPCYNQLSYTYACLASILEHGASHSYEVIIADDVSTDETRQLEHFAEGLVISRNACNQGFLKNCNQAAARARGEFLFFLNNDTTVTEGWLDWLLKLMEDPTVGMAGSKLVYPDGKLQEAGGIIWSDASGWNYGRMQDPSRPEFNYVKEVDYISGAAILVRRSLWEEIGGFDERYAPAYCEDSDLAFEVRKRGYRVLYQPKSVVVHYEGVSNGTDVQGSGLKRYQLENTGKFREKWKEELKKQFENTGNPDPFRARERSGGKKIILVVDHYVPTFDRDAGSRTTWQYLQMFVKQGYCVKFLGDNFACEEPYTTALRQLGVEVLCGREMQAEIWGWIERHAKDIAAVYLNRPHIASKYIDFIQSRTRIKVLYYGHDLHFLRERREYELTGNPEKKEASEYWKGVELSLMHKADMSFYPSEAECRAVRRIDPGIRVRALTAYLWESFPENIERDYGKREGLLFVGGFSHPPNADAVRWFLDEIWPKIRAEEELNFYVAGSGAPEEILARNAPEQGIHILGFVSDERLEELYRSCRMAVVPLRYGAGVKGKVIEALYYGLPVLTTSVGAEGIPEAEQVMEIADDAESFAKLALRLHGGTEELLRMSEASERYVRKYHSMDAAWEAVREYFP